MREHTKEAQDILMKWLMSDHTNEQVTVSEMHKVKKCIESLETSHDDLLEVCKETKLLLNEVAEWNIQPFPIRALELNRRLIKILAIAKPKQ